MPVKDEICVMPILVLAASKMEVASFLTDNKEVDILIAGIGIPATIYHLQKRLTVGNYDLVIQAGIAGAFDESILLSEVVLVKQDTFGDLGMEEKETFIPVFESGFMDKNEFPFKDGWLVNQHDLLTSKTWRSVDAITVNKVSDSKVQHSQALLNFSPQIESMEGAAFHYVCLNEKVPFLQLRSISNYVGERNKANWKMKESIMNLDMALSALIDAVKI